MAINSTRGLPSFSEMYSAFKNRGSLADTLKSGMEGYEKGVKMQADKKMAAVDTDLKKASTEEKLAEAAYKRSQATQPKGATVNLAALPDAMRAQLAPYADAQGNVPESTAKIAMSTTKQGQDATMAQDKLALMQQQLEERQKAAAEQARLAEENMALKQQISQGAQSNAAAATALQSLDKDPAPSWIDKGLGKIGVKTDAMKAEEQRKALQQTLAAKGGAAPYPTQSQGLDGLPEVKPVASPAPVTGDLRSRAVAELRAAGAPVTEANIAEAMRQLGGR